MLYHGPHERHELWNYSWLHLGVSRTFFKTFVGLRWMYMTHVACHMGMEVELFCFPNPQVLNKDTQFILIIECLGHSISLLTSSWNLNQPISLNLCIASRSWLYGSSGILLLGYLVDIFDSAFLSLCFFSFPFLLSLTLPCYKPNRLLSSTNGKNLYL